VNLGGEASKTGVPPAAVEALIAAVRGHVQVAGLMTIPPPGANPEASRPYFAQLRELRDRLAPATGLKLSELSMGMTEDYAIAIEEGATIVRVGRAVFGERNS
jgi:PLP dependent protein